MSKMSKIKGVNKATESYLIVYFIFKGFKTNKISVCLYWKCIVCCRPNSNRERDLFIVDTRQDINFK